MIPQKLTLVNYCQHRNLTLDFRDASIIAISSINGGGKSNAFAALKHALTGLKSNGAQKLVDDILDDAPHATIDLEFQSTTGVQGRIIRQINRKGSNSVALRMGDIEKTKSTEAIAHFEELIGVTPSAVCDIVIAEQNAIEELLFTSKKRLERFEQFLHGDTFNQPYQSVQSLIQRLHIDENAQQRIHALEQSIRSCESALGTAQGQINRLNVTLLSDKALQLKEKQTKVQRFNTLVQQYNDRAQELEQYQTQLAQAKTALNALPETQSETLAKLTTAVRQLRENWSAFDTYNLIKERYEQLTCRKTTLANNLRQHHHKVQELRQLQTQASLLQDIVTARTFEQTHTQLLTEQKTLQVALKDLEQQKAEIQPKTQEMETLAGQAKGTVNLLEDAQKLATAALNEECQDASCPICNSNLVSALEASPIEGRLQNAREHHHTLQTMAHAHREQLNAVVKQLTRTQRDLEQLNTQITSHQNARPESPDAPQYNNWTLSQLQTQQQAWAETLTQLPSKEQQLYSVKEQLSQANEELQQIQLPKPAPAKPHKPKDAIQEGENQIDQLTKTINERTRLTENISTYEKISKTINEKLNECIQKAKAEGLPSLKSNYRITETEAAYLAQIEEKQAQEEKLQIECLRHQTLLLQYTKDRKNTQKAVDGAQETEACQQFLTQVGKRIRQLPQEILKGQLAAICKHMDSIVRDFYLRTPFQLDIDDNLNFIMRYPSGKTRNIQKASGGERIILGIAFRLAAHQKLAPEMPWLVIDEPTNCLSPENVRVMADVIRYLKTNLGKYNLQKLIFSSHTPIVTSQAEQIIEF